MSNPHVPRINISFDYAKGLYDSLVKIRATDDDPENFSNAEKKRGAILLSVALNSNRPKKMSSETLKQLTIDLGNIIELIKNGTQNQNHTI